MMHNHTEQFTGGIMNRATPYRHQPGHEERSLFSYFRSIFQKYADRDFFFIGRTAAYFFFFCAAVYAAMDSAYCRTIPILAMTANAFEEDRTLATEAGMNGYLTKPIDVEKMMKTIASFL